jgi:hypothetical protein
MSIGLLVPAVLAQDPIAYLCIALPSGVPLYLWLRAGALGMPILPIVSGLYFVYYALPMLRTQVIPYGSDQLIDAGATVGGFLVAASIGSWPFLRTPRRTGNDAPSLISQTQVVRLVAIGIGAGILYHLALVSVGLGPLGPYLGLFRSVVLTLTSVACYFLGCARAFGWLRGARWTFALGALFLLVVLALSNLFLVGGLMNLLAAFLGYVITAKRIPWIGLATACVVLAVLHAGKNEIRQTYWAPHSQSLEEVSVSQIPGMMTDWVAAGIDAFQSGTAENVLERTSLLHMLLLVQRATPDFIPYLDGETYALLPSLLLPRFVDPDKPQSQAGLNLLSVRYGVQSVESTASTTIAWGLIAEAYANFGHLGALPVGLLLGALCGVLTRISIAAAPLSLRMLVTVAAAIALFNVEMDLSYLITTLAQSVAAVMMFAALPKLWAGSRRRPIHVERPPLPMSQPHPVD